MSLATAFLWENRSPFFAICPKTPGDGDITGTLGGTAKRLRMAFRGPESVDEVANLAQSGPQYLTPWSRLGADRFSVCSVLLRWVDATVPAPPLHTPVRSQARFDGVSPLELRGATFRTSREALRSNGEAVSPSRSYDALRRELDQIADAAVPDRFDYWATGVRSEGSGVPWGGRLPRRGNAPCGDPGGSPFASSRILFNGADGSGRQGDL